MWLKKFFEAKVFAEILKIALPLILSNILQQLYNTTDAIIVGRGVGDNALSAVGASSYVILILTYIFIGLTVGASIHISHAFGAGDQVRITRLLHTAMGIALVSGLILTVVGVFGAGYFLRLNGVPAEVYPLSLEYLRIYFIGITFSMLYNMGSAILRGIGNTKISFYCLIVSTTINILLDILFVFRFGWGIQSVAIATVISQMIAATIILWTLRKRGDFCKLYFCKICLRREETKDILRLGLPSGLQSVVQSLSNLYVQTQIYTFGAIVLAGVTAYIKVEGFFYMAIEGIAVALSVLSGQLIGRGQPQKIQKYLIGALVLCASIIIPLSALFHYFDRAIISLFIENEQSVQEGIRMLRIITPLYMIYGASQILSNVVKGVGQTKLSMKVVLIFTCGFRVLWVMLTMKMYRSIELLYYVYPVSWALTGLVFVYCYWRLKKTDFVKFKS